MKVLGVDFGLRKIGLAIAEEGLAQPLLVIENPAKFVERIANICQENEVGRIVIGLPEGRIAEKVKEFASNLSLVVSLPIDFQDETLTTREAIVRMITVGKKRKKRRKEEDAFAAACILQEYLDKRR